MRVYYNQDKISSGFSNFLKNIFPLSKPHLKIISFILSGMISAESVVTSDIARKLKDDFSLVNLDSIQRRFRRFFSSLYSVVSFAFVLSLFLDFLVTILMPSSSPVILEILNLLTKLNIFLMFFTLDVYLKLISLLLDLLILSNLGILLPMITPLVPFAIILIVSLLNVFLNLKNLMASDLKALILKRNLILFLYSLLCVLLFFGLPFLVLIMLKTNIIIIFISVTPENARTVPLTDSCLFSTLVLLFLTSVITIISILF